MLKTLRLLSATLSLALAASAQASAEAQGNKLIRIAFTFSMPPYLSTNLDSGIELDVIKSALHATGPVLIHVQNIHYLRAIKLAESGQIDLIASNKSNNLYEQELPDVATSDTTIHYVDCAISLRSRNLTLDTIDDYSDKRIWAFKTASLSLGSAFQDMALSNPEYTEDFDQIRQLDMLRLGRIDIAISDRNIFTQKLLKKEGADETMFTFSPIGQPTPRVVRATNINLINQVNRGLSIIRENGDYGEVLEQYRDAYVGHCQ